MHEKNFNKNDNQDKTQQLSQLEAEIAQIQGEIDALNSNNEIPSTTQEIRNLSDSVNQVNSKDISDTKATTKKGKEKMGKYSTAQKLKMAAAGTLSGLAMFAGGSAALKVANSPLLSTPNTPNPTEQTVSANNQIEAEPGLTSNSPEDVDETTINQTDENYDDGDENYGDGDENYGDENENYGDENENYSSININGETYNYGYFRDMSNPENLAKLETKIKNKILSGEHNKRITSAQEEYQILFIQNLPFYIKGRVAVYERNISDKLSGEVNMWTGEKTQELKLPFFGNQLQASMYVNAHQSTDEFASNLVDSLNGKAQEEVAVNENLLITDPGYEFQSFKTKISRDGITHLNNGLLDSNILNSSDSLELSMFRSSMGDIGVYLLMQVEDELGDYATEFDKIAANSNC